MLREDSANPHFPTGFPASRSDILPIPVDYPDETTEFAIQPGVPAQPVPRAIGKRHENASANARALLTPEEPLVKQALTAAQELFESASVTAAHDLMVLSVERRQEESMPAESEGPAASQASNSDFWESEESPGEAAAEAAAERAAAENGAEDHHPAEAEPAKEQRSRSRQRAPVDELEWDPLPQPQEAHL